MYVESPVRTATRAGVCVWPMTTNAAGKSRARCPARSMSVGSLSSFAPNQAGAGT